MSVEDTAKIHNNPDLNKPFSRPMPLLATCCHFLQLIPQISPKMFVSLSFFRTFVLVIIIIITTNIHSDDQTKKLPAFRGRDHLHHLWCAMIFHDT